MVYNTRNQWDSGHCPSFGILNTRKHSVSETDLFPSSSEWGKIPTLDQCWRLVLYKGPNPGRWVGR
jgi:hypothetical protein